MISIHTPCLVNQPLEMTGNERTSLELDHTALDFSVSEPVEVGGLNPHQQLFLCVCDIQQQQTHTAHWRCATLCVCMATSCSRTHRFTTTLEEEGEEEEEKKRKGVYTDQATCAAGSVQ